MHFINSIHLFFFSLSVYTPGFIFISTISNHCFFSVGTKFGAASPQAVRKMLALSDPHKTRPYQPKHCAPPLPVPGLALHSSTLESSPGAPRRVGSGSSRVPMHERSHSDTPSGLPPPVDLSAESSSVTSLSNLQPLRKTLTSGKCLCDGFLSLSLFVLHTFSPPAAPRASRCVRYFSASSLSLSHITIIIYYYYYYCYYIERCLYSLFIFDITFSWFFFFFIRRDMSGFFSRSLSLVFD